MERGPNNVMSLLSLEICKQRPNNHNFSFAVGGRPYQVILLTFRFSTSKRKRMVPFS